MEENERTVPTVTIPVTFTPSSAAALVDRIAPLLENVAEQAVEIANRFMDWLKTAVASAAKAAKSIMETLLQSTTTHPKWWHLYKHAKKARTRKKYRRRLIDELLSNMRAAARDKEEAHGKPSQNLP